MKKLILACLVVLAAAFGGRSVDAQVVTAKITGGTVQGVVNGNIVSFKGIPFAAPPTGDFRWRPPQPVASWPNVKLADTFAPGCMQDPAMAVMFGAPPRVKEDCLYLKIGRAHV